MSTAGRIRTGWSDLLRRTLFFAGVAFVGYLAFRSRGTLAALWRDADHGLLLLSLALAVVANLAAVPVFHGLLGKVGIVVEMRVAARLYLYAQVAKYVPGKVWILVYQAAYLGGRAALDALVVVNLEAVAVGLFVFGGLATALLLPGAAAALVPALLAFSFLGAFWVFRSRRFHRAVSALAARLRRRATTSAAPEPPGGGLARVALYTAANWLVYAPAIVLCLVAALGIGPEQAAVLAGMHLGATLVAIAGVVFPAGMGLRELLFLGAAGLLPGAVPDDGVVMAAAVLLRFWQVAHDVAGALIARWTWR